MKKILIVLSLLLSLQGIAQADSDWVYFSETGHYYKRFDTVMTWNDAKSYAESIGGYLATINSENENTFLFNNIGNITFPDDVVWLGGTDEAQEGVWKWVTGETFWDNGTCLLYCNWGSVEPNNYQGNQNYLNYNSHIYNGQWDDEFNRSTPFIVEMNSAPPVTPEPISFILFLTGGAVLGARNLLRRRKSGFLPAQE
ncbi:MAG: hypothetical protein HY806_01725 [Nitrospirae bacterium]|nr:hypothetical protein [Nitrospirota bacterium]